MPKRLTLLERGAVKEIGRIKFKPLVTVGNFYRLRGDHPFAKDTSIYGGVTVLTTGDGFYLMMHYPVRKVGKHLFVLTPEDEKDILDGGINDAINFTFSHKENVKALKSVRKAHLTFKREYPGGSQVITVMTFTTLKPVALTVGVSKGKRYGLELPPDLLYTLKDRDAIEEAGIVIGAGTQEVIKNEKVVQRLANDVARAHKDLHTVYKVIIGNHVLAGGKVTLNTLDKNWIRKFLRLVKYLKDPLLVDISNNFLNVLPSIAVKNGYQLLPDLKLYFSFEIPIGSTKGGFEIKVLSGKAKQEVDFVIPNPNPRGRKKYIKVKSLLFYATANNYLKHKHSKAKKQPVVDVLGFEHLLK